MYDIAIINNTIPRMPLKCRELLCFAAHIPTIQPIAIAMWGWWMKESLTPVICIVGIIGNCMSFVVMKSKSLRHKSYSHYICGLAIFDSLSLIGQEISMIDDLVYYINGGSLFSNFTDGGCKLYNFAEYICYLMSSWLIVFMALERVVVIYYPFRKPLLCSQRGALSIIIALFVVVCYTQIFRFIMIEHSGGHCGAKTEYLMIFATLHTYFYQLCLAFTLPVTIVFASNMMVLYKIRMVQKDATDETTQTTRLRRFARRRHKTTYMLLAISFTYIFTMLPLMIVSGIAIIAIHSQYHDAHALLARLSPFKDLFELISLINYGINFFIYIMSGRSFRFELKRILRMDSMSSGTGIRTREEMLRL